MKKIIESGELFNSNKEFIAKNQPINQSTNKPINILVRYRDDFVGQSKLALLNRDWCNGQIINIKKGVVWQINSSAPDSVEKILATRILFNQYSQIAFNLTNVILSPRFARINSAKDLDSSAPPQNDNKHMDYTEIIGANLNNCLTHTDLGIGKKKIGKVRDTYELPDKMILITTDRQSAFDRILASVPFKGQVLNQTSAWWFEKTKHIVPNHILSIPDPNVTVGKKCTVFPVEFVVRGYITGTTDTSAWVNYQKGVRDYCGNLLPEGLKKNQKFAQPIITPTTKSDEHDRLISPKEIVSEELMTQTEWDYVSAKALELFSFGQKIAAEHGLILVDTKYEFGKDADGNIMIIDEMHTPDSSRYWIAKSYDERMNAEQEPENIDKEFLRLWFKEHCDPYHDKELPPAPAELVTELSRRYIMLYEMITGEKFVFPESANINKRITNNLKNI